VCEFQPHQNERATVRILTDQARGEKLPAVIGIDEEKTRPHVDGVVRASVEETLNGPLWGDLLLLRVPGIVRRDNRHLRPLSGLE
jgi:hypothetical protein